MLFSAVSIHFRYMANFKGYNDKELSRLIMEQQIKLKSYKLTNANSLNCVLKTLC